MSLPAILNEVISVTGEYSFPFALSPSTLPIDQPIGSIPRPTGPVIVFGNLTNTSPGAGPNPGTVGAVGSGLTTNMTILSNGDSSARTTSAAFRPRSTGARPPTSLLRLKTSRRSRQR